MEDSSESSHKKEVERTMWLKRSLSGTLENNLPMFRLNAPVIIYAEANWEATEDNIVGDHVMIVQEVAIRAWNWFN